MLTTNIVRADGGGNAQTLGVDYNIRADRNRVFLNGAWAGTHAPGTGGVKTGLGGTTNFGFTRKHASVYTNVDHIDPNFRVTDLGFIRGRVNLTQVSPNVVLEQPDPWKALRRFTNSAGMSYGWSDEGLVFSQAVFENVSMQFRNFWSMETGFSRTFEVLDDLDTRGGPPIGVPPNSEGFIFVGSDLRRAGA